MVSCSVLRRQDHSSLLTETSRVRPGFGIGLYYSGAEILCPITVASGKVGDNKGTASRFTKSRSPFATKLLRVSKPTKFIKLKKDNPVDWNHSPDVGHTGSYPYVCPLANTFWLFGGCHRRCFSKTGIYDGGHHKENPSHIAKAELVQHLGDGHSKCRSSGSELDVANCHCLDI
ncbi:hypothetical protein OUZ56_030949 [Daphnia magna]|uniref:Uncharacterized protein n=1 Tax=Daphnia magna TaxID=35525 RepID=A0ABQ9ZTN6_9CRUS|nr:hypothetical protein OUZ56_030949 [Daphnia magna]